MMQPDINCYCDYDPPDFYFASIRKARKRYKCYDCQMPILPGDRYEYLFASWDGYKDQHATCEWCYDIRVWLKNNLPCFCYAHGGLDETAGDALEDAYSRARRGVPYGEPHEATGLWFGYQRRKILRDRVRSQRWTEHGYG